MEAEFHDALEESISTSTSSPSDSQFTQNLKNTEKLDEGLNSTTVNRSSITSISHHESVTVDSPNPTPNLLHIITQLAIHVMGFQAKLLLNSVNFSIRLIYSSYMLFNNPYNIIRLGSSWLPNHDPALKLCARIGWALLWVAYCGFVLLSLLVSALVISGVIVKRVVDEPVQITEQLVFDYTKDTPTAFAPVISCTESALLVYKRKSKIGIGRFVGTRAVPVGHELKATVSLVLPESDYNRKLGIFQVRVDFLSSDNTLLTTSRRPSMLRFKSDPIRLLSTFLKLPSLLTGYPSETQTLRININGYTEKAIPLSCLRVAIEQRAEFAKGAGVPEIYSAFIKLESRFSFLKRMLWYWKWLIYMWISMMMFVMELLFTMLCCAPVIFPWVRRVGGYSVNIASDSHSKPPG
ncbi:seipin-2-like [Bidens hawaiensis]|uniref:seipin-2-like n=1 Tax=Bidens hawaiensis TaxID=980011 RepID=UPI00404A7E4C